MHTLFWLAECEDEAFCLGPHKSSQGERAFVSAAGEMIDFCRQGYWLVLPQGVVSDWPNLRILPLGVVLQRDRRPRLIVDYSFSSVNAETVQLAPHEAMQFGRALQRVLSIIVHVNRRYGRVHLAKIDIADGFYRVWIQIDNVPKQAWGLVLPTAPGSGPLVVFPLALPMGWVLSPPDFTVLTKMACDLANAIIKERLLHARLTATRWLEAVADTPPSDADAFRRPILVYAMAAPRFSGSPIVHPWRSQMYMWMIFSFWRKPSRRSNGKSYAPQYLRLTRSFVLRVLMIRPTARIQHPSRRCIRGMRSGPPGSASWDGTSTRCGRRFIYPFTVCWSVYTKSCPGYALLENGCLARNGTNSLGNCVPCPQPSRAHEVSFPSCRTPSATGIAIAFVSTATSTPSQRVSSRW